MDATFVARDETNSHGAYPETTWRLTPKNGGGGNIPADLANGARSGASISFGAVGEDGENPIEPGIYVLTGTSKVPSKKSGSPDTTVSDSMDVVIVGFTVNIDSQNENGVYGGPPDKPRDDRAELPGKFVPVNDHSPGNDGVPGFARFDAGGRFVPFSVEIVPFGALDMYETKLEFGYSASNPGSEMKKGPEDKPYYEPAAGGARVWTKDASASRTPQSVADDSGDWVPAGVELDAYRIATAARTPLYLEGVRAGANPITVSLKNGEIGIDVSDTVAATVIKVDLDIDSTNEGSIQTTEFNHQDQIEDVQVRPGAALAINELDRRKNGIPDFADGYDIGFGGGSNSAANASHDFKEVTLRFPEGIDLDKATVVFRSDALSNPASVSRAGTGTREDGHGAVNNPFVYSVTDGGKIRLWTKNGSELRRKALVPAGDAILKDSVIKVADLNPGSNREVKLYLEALFGSVTLGDIRLKVELDPDGESGPAGWVHSDAARATVFHIENVHPIANDFTTDQVGKVMISTRQDADKSNAYYTNRGVTTRDGKKAQSEDEKIVVSAYVIPLPPVEYPNLTVYFEVTDPDDKSPYDGKSQPSDATNTNPNDNRDPNRRMTWNNGAPAGYAAYQAACLSTRSDAAVEANIAGTRRVVAETTLEITNRYAGDNYQVRSTMQKPHNNEPFDTLSGMTPNVPLAASTVKQSQTLTAWKRVYIELDRMYNRGATITRAGQTNNRNIRVDNVADFAVGDNVVIFLRDGTQISRSIERINASNNQITINSAPGIALPMYAGVRPAAAPPTYQVDIRYLENAFGRTPDGSYSPADIYLGQGAGAFTEFRTLPVDRGSGNVPKYREFPSHTDWEEYAVYWFNNHGQRQRNVLHLLAAHREASGGVGGWAWRVGNPHDTNNQSICVVFTGGITCNIARDEIVVHEIGHRFDLVDEIGGRFSYIDTHSMTQNHAGNDHCIMDYDNDWHDGITEFSVPAILTGSSNTAGDSLRDRIDN